jgi:hypothetical protein
MQKELLSQGEVGLFLGVTLDLVKLNSFQQLMGLGLRGILFFNLTVIIALCR